MGRCFWESFSLRAMFTKLCGWSFGCFSIRDCQTFTLAFRMILIILSGCISALASCAFDYCGEKPFEMQNSVFLFTNKNHHLSVCESLFKRIWQQFSDVLARETCRIRWSVLLSGWIDWNHRKEKNQFKSSSHWYFIMCFLKNGANLTTNPC